MIAHHRVSFNPEAVVQTRVERASSANDEALIEIGEADEDGREQRAALPGVVEEDVWVIDGILVEQVRFVDEEDRQGTLARELLDVLGDG